MIESIKNRRSIRRYTGKEISENILRELVDCGRLAPSADNVQPALFIVIRNKEKLEKISAMAVYGKFIKNAAACIVVVCEDTEYWLEDGCTASENILIAANALGLGGCWVAGTESEGKVVEKQLLDLLEVPRGYHLVSILSLGYPDEKPTHGKKKIEEILRWESFNSK